MKDLSQYKNLTTLQGQNSLNLEESILLYFTLPFKNYFKIGNQVGFQVWHVLISAIISLLVGFFLSAK